MTVWTDFVKKYASSHGINYAQALKDPKCGEEYRSSKAIAPSHLKGKSAKMYHKQDMAKEALLKFQEAKLKRKAKKGKVGMSPEPDFGMVLHY
jgi:hypothetical protein